MRKGNFSSLVSKLLSKKSNDRNMDNINLETPKFSINEYVIVPYFIDKELLSKLNIESIYIENKGSWVGLPIIQGNLYISENLLLTMNKFDKLSDCYNACRVHSTYDNKVNEIEYADIINTFCMN